MKRPLILLATLWLAACAGRTHGTSSSSRTNSGGGDDLDHKLMPGLYAASTPGQSAPTGVAVPLLRAPEWESAYGKPTYRIMKDGSYIADYKGHGDSSNGGSRDYLTIIGTSRKLSALPFPVTQGPWRVLGKDVAWFWSGNESPEITTEAFSLTAPDGRTSTYKIIFGGSDRALEKRLPKICW